MQVTRILKGDVEREASVATNLRRIVNRLPNDLILKWQTVNYELVKSGRSAGLKDVAEFVLQMWFYEHSLLRLSVSLKRQPSQRTRTIRTIANR